MTIYPSLINNSTSSPLYLYSCLCLLFIASYVLADTSQNINDSYQIGCVSWNFNVAGPVLSEAGVVSVGNWNNSQPDEPVTNLIDHTGSPTTIDVNYISFDNSSMESYTPDQDDNDTYNKALLNGYLSGGRRDRGDITVYAQLTLSEIICERYDIIIYFSGDQEGFTGSVSDGITSYYFKTLGPDSISGDNANLRRTISTHPLAYQPANYAIFRNLSGESQSLTVQMTDQHNSCGIAALQLIPSGYTPSGEFTGYCQTITNVATGWLLEAEGNTAEANVRTGPNEDGSHQRWHIFGSNGRYSIRSIQSDYRGVDCTQWGTANGTNIQIWNYTGDDPQKFDIVPVDEQSSIYRIVTVMDTRKCLQVVSSGRGGTNNVVLQTYTGADNQHWILSGDAREDSITLQPGDDIQAAIERYRTVNLTEGTWLVYSSLLLHGGLTINGAGMFQTTLEIPSPALDYWHSIFVNSNVGTLKDTTIKNLKFNGNNGGSHGINPQNPINMQVENIWCLNLRGMGVSTGGSWNCYYDNVVCDTCGQATFDPSWHNWYSRRINGDVIVNSVCKNCPKGDGMKLSHDCFDITVANCTFYGNDYNGMITQDYLEDITILNCTSFYNGFNTFREHKGFYIYGNMDSLIENCVAYDNHTWGFYVITNGGGRPWIRNCTAYSNNWGGFEIHGGWKWDGIKSRPDTLPPAAPMGITAIGGNNVVVLDWEDNAVDDQASYSVYRALSPDGDYELVASNLENSNYLDTTVSSGTKYYYVLTATDTTGNESTHSGWISAIPD